ncbi:MAG TPA: hypothetical protein VKE26_26160 [Xanthobacteraceae bacterium]|nr:hypothetical protein [Xanthobacteraceae bacterium]
MPRTRKTALEIMGEIGHRVYDLRRYDEHDVITAVVLLRTVNGPLFDWLMQMLLAGSLIDGTAPAVGAVDPHAPDTGTPSPRE